MQKGDLTINSFKERYIKVKDSLKKEFSYKNDMAVPMVQKISVNIGVGEYARDKNKLKGILNDLELISGQKPVYVKTNKAISDFKLRAGATVGLKVTLRGKNMEAFFNRFVMMVLPRIRDFHGISSKKFDGNGNLSIGIKEHIVFPEIKPEESVANFGLQVNITTSAKTDEEGFKLLSLLGFPLIK